MGCGRSFPQSGLLRLCHDRDGHARPDLERRETGRGAYVCPDRDCHAALQDGRALSRAFRARITVDEATLDFIEKWQRRESTK